MLDKATLCVLGSTERMAIHQTKHQSDLEKRLQLLRRQVYGKEFRVKDKIITDSSTDISFLNQDLFKIFTLSSLAIGAQIILFFLLKNHILNLNFL
ncbi:hypothetical protein HYU94_01755 [Candidatus Daviesbacteria bacterium]|nr:hypothetical protein [Candidatus Daviesbacteria bacterium]